MGVSRRNRILCYWKTESCIWWRKSTWFEFSRRLRLQVRSRTELVWSFGIVIADDCKVNLHTFINANRSLYFPLMVLAMVFLDGRMLPSGFHRDTLPQIRRFCPAFGHFITFFPVREMNNMRLTRICWCYISKVDPLTHCWQQVSLKKSTL